MLPHCLQVALPEGTSGQGRFVWADELLGELAEQDANRHGVGFTRRLCSPAGRTGTLECLQRLLGYGDYRFRYAGAA
ncbi:hypothetical protein D3C76_1015760 [compost metagenome]